MCYNALFVDLCLVIDLPSYESHQISIDIYFDLCVLCLQQMLRKSIVIQLSEGDLEHKKVLKSQSIKFLMSNEKKINIWHICRFCGCIVDALSCFWRFLIWLSCSLTWARTSSICCSTSACSLATCDNKIVKKSQNVLRYGRVSYGQTYRGKMSVIELLRNLVWHEIVSWEFLKEKSS